MDTITNLINNLNVGTAVITAFVYHQQVTWFVCDKDLWFYPSHILASLLQQPLEASLPYHESDQERGMLLNTDDIDRLYRWMQPYHVSITQLQIAMQRFIPPTTSWDLFMFEPCFYINADTYHFVSHYSEPIEYETFIPPTWTGVYGDFMPLIPIADCYWIIDDCDWISYGWSLENKKEYI